MREQEKFLKENSIQVAVVSFEADYLAKKYIEDTGVNWPLLVDEKRELYHAYGMLEASLWDIWGPKTWLVYCKEILSGHMPQKSSGDVSQRGGDVLIDPQGIVRFHHVGTGPADRPSVESVMKHVRHKENTTS